MAARAAVLAAAAGALIASAGVAAASIWVTGPMADPSLRVDVKGNAEVDWTAGGKKHTQLVPRTGQVLPGGHVKSDVSKPASAPPGVPFVKVARKTPDGTTWVLQFYDGALRLANWQGDPTKLELSHAGQRLVGSVTFHGQPVTGFSPTPAGQKQRIYVYIDCFGCPAGRKSWTPMLGVTPRSNGSFKVYLRSSWTGARYRATMVGPNLGTVRAPDAQTIISA